MVAVGVMPRSVINACWKAVRIHKVDPVAFYRVGRSYALIAGRDGALVYLRWRGRKVLHFDSTMVPEIFSRRHRWKCMQVLADLISTPDLKKKTHRKTGVAVS